MQANGHTISLKVPQTDCVKTSENPCETRSTSVLLQLSPARDEMGLRLVSAAQAAALVSAVAAGVIAGMGFPWSTASTILNPVWKYQVRELSAMK